MFDIGWTELLLIGVVALIVIGPKDLPEMFRQLGRFTAKLRSMSRDFQRAMEQAANESGVKDVAKDLKGMTSAKGLGLDAVKDAASKFEKWDPLKPAKPAAQPLKPAPMPPAAAPPAAAPPVGAAEAQPLPEPAVAPTIHGPATQAQIDKKAAKAAILKETAARLKAVDAAPQDPPAPAPVAKTKPPKPRAPRKPAKKADDA